jgi:hypothetical protein
VFARIERPEPGPEVLVLDGQPIAFNHDPTTG